jgi:hypothetical protein
MARTTRDTRAFDESLRAESLAFCRKYVPEGARVYYRYVSFGRQNMGCTLRLYMARDGEIWNLTGHASRLTEYVMRDRDGERVLQVKGCGYNRGASVVEALAHAVYGRGDALIAENL